MSNGLLNHSLFGFFAIIVIMSNDYSQLCLHRFYQKTGVSCPVLDRAFTRYFNIVFHGRPELSQNRNEMKQQDNTTKNDPFKGYESLTSLTVGISDCSEVYPSLDSLESCKSPLIFLTLIIIYSAITTNKTKHNNTKQYFQIDLEQQKRSNYCDP